MYKLFFCCLVLFLFACKTKEDVCVEMPFKNSSISVLDKLVGTWKNDDGIHFERWKKIDSTHFLSDVYTLKGADTTFLEKATVTFLKQHWIFENWVKGQNNEKHVVFKAKYLNTNHIAFLNPLHDFPTEIHYLLRSDSLLGAFIVGKSERNKLDTIRFNYERIAAKK